jgi:hypothetical protein
MMVCGDETFGKEEVDEYGGLMKGLVSLKESKLASSHSLSMTEEMLNQNQALTRTQPSWYPDSEFPTFCY